MAEESDAVCASLIAPRLRQKSTCSFRPWLSVSSTWPHTGHSRVAGAATFGQEGTGGAVAVDDSGFVVDEAEIVFWGLCPACAGRSAGSRHHHVRTGDTDPAGAPQDSHHEER